MGTATARLRPHRVQPCLLNEANHAAYATEDKSNMTGQDNTLGCLNHEVRLFTESWI